MNSIRLQPSFWPDAKSQSVVDGQEDPGRVTYPILADKTAPSEKNAERRVNMYCLLWGRFSMMMQMIMRQSPNLVSASTKRSVPRNKVPSVGIDPPTEQHII